jgi:phenylpropionate dioxygenase-like ring-hydroxylating dioxygenase large terminal subunit
MPVILAPDAILSALRRAWFAVARVDELDQPREAMLLGESLVVFRLAGGAPAVLANRCPHRGAALAGGEVHGSSVICPYHGWEWRGNDGACTRIPSLNEGERIPGNTHVKAYPAQVRWGLVWTCLDEPAMDIPDPEELHGTDWDYDYGETMEIPAGIGALTENFRDVSHFPFVHRASMGDVPEIVEPLRVRREGIEVWLDRGYTTINPGQAVWQTDSEIMFRYHIVAPCFICLVMDYGPLGSRFLLNAPHPTTDLESTCINWIVGVSKGFRGPSLAECVASETAVYREDLPVLSSLRPREIEWHRPAQFSVPADRYTLAYRRSFVEFVRRANSVAVRVPSGNVRSV